jgi:hypothetical protein
MAPDLKRDFGESGKPTGFGLPFCVRHLPIETKVEWILQKET